MVGGAYRLYDGAGNLRLVSENAAAAGAAGSAGKALQRTAKALKALGWVGMGASLVYNANEVMAGAISWEEGIVDTVSPVSVQDMRATQEYVNNSINEWQANARANIGRRDSNRTLNGGQPFPIER